MARVCKENSSLRAILQHTYLRIPQYVVRLTVCFIWSRWVVLRQAHALSRLRDDARPVPAALWEENGRPALHTCSAGRDLLVSRHFVSLRYEIHYIYQTLSSIDTYYDY